MDRRTLHIVRILTMLAVVTLLWVSETLAQLPVRTSAVHLISNNNTNYTLLRSANGQVVNYSIVMPPTSGSTASMMLRGGSGGDAEMYWLAPGAEGQALTISGGVPAWSTPSSGWLLTGNSGTIPGTNFVGTTDNVALQIHVNSTRALLITPTTGAANIVGGASANAIASGVIGGTISGGGHASFANSVYDDYGTVAGGIFNRAGDNSGTTSDRPWATVGGGNNNAATGEGSTVAGGRSNLAQGSHSAIPGGRGLTLTSTASGSFGFAGNIAGTNDFSVSQSNIAFFGNVNLWLGNNDGTARELRLYEAYSTAGVFPSTANYTALRAGTQSADITYTFPVTAPTATNTVLISDITGQMSWANPSNLGSFWSLSGNTLAGTEFLGSLNNQPVEIRVNNSQVLRFNTNGSIQRDNGGDTRGISAVDLQIDRTSADQVASGNRSVIAGGENNRVSNNHSSIVGGQSNWVSGYNAFIGGGNGNTVSNNHGVVVGGQSNVSSGANAFVGAGNGNSATNLSTFVGGGNSNTASGQYAFVGGGNSNTASDEGAFVGGGNSNSAGGQHSFVGAGNSNFIGSTSTGQAIIVGGNSNTISNNSNRSIILGGQDNAVQAASNSTILGGSGLTLNANRVAGINLNNAAGTASMSIASANTNTFIIGNANLWLGNTNNTRSELRFYIAQSATGTFPAATTRYVALRSAAAMAANTTYDLPTAYPDASNYVLVSTTAGVMSWANASTLVGSTFWALGGNTLASASNIGTVSNHHLPIVTNNTERMRINATGEVGIGTTATAGYLLHVAGTAGTPNVRIASLGNPVKASPSAGFDRVVVANSTGDLDQVATTFLTSILEEESTGQANVRRKVTFTNGVAGSVVGTYSIDLQAARAFATQTASGQYAGILSGLSNTASGAYSIVTGGSSGTASGSYSFVGSGQSNTASGNYSLVGGGQSNTASGSHSVITGGQSNTVSGSHSMAFGYGANVTQNNTVVFNHPTAGDGLTRVGIDIDNPQTSLDIDGGLTVRPPTTVQINANGATLTVGNRSYIVLNPNGGNRTGLILSDGLQAGQILILRILEGQANSVAVPDAGSSNVNLTGNWVGNADDTITMIWTGTDWIELSRSNN